MQEFAGSLQTHDKVAKVDNALASMPILAGSPSRPMETTLQEINSLQNFGEKSLSQRQTMSLMNLDQMSNSQKPTGTMDGRFSAFSSA